MPILLSLSLSLSLFFFNSEREGVSGFLAPQGPFGGRESGETTYDWRRSWRRSGALCRRCRHRRADFVVVRLDQFAFAVVGFIGLQPLAVSRESNGDVAVIQSPFTVVGAELESEGNDVAVRSHLEGDAWAVEDATPLLTFEF